MGKQVATRDIKMETIRRSVERCNREHLPGIKEKIIAECGKWWGTARQSAQTMMKEMEANEEIHVDGEDVWTYSQWERISDNRTKELNKGKLIINDVFATQWQK